MTLYAEQYWKKRFATDREQLEQKRQAGLTQAAKAASTMRQRWPLIKAINLFGSILGEQFRSYSDLDLLVDGLPPESLINAIGTLKKPDLCQWT